MLILHRMAIDSPANVLWTNLFIILDCQLMSLQFVSFSTRNHVTELHARNKSVIIIIIIIIILHLHLDYPHMISWFANAASVYL